LSRGGRPIGAVGIKSKLAEYDLNRLGVNPIEEVVKAAKELDEIKALALKAYAEFRGVTENSDGGTQYMANALRCVSEKAQIYLKLARFKHPELSAVAIKDMSDVNEAKEPMTTRQALTILTQDPFSPKEVREIDTEKIIEAMESNIETPFLPSGEKK
jgi:hypothetical protein